MKLNQQKYVHGIEINRYKINNTNKRVHYGGLCESQYCILSQKVHDAQHILSKDQVVYSDVGWFGWHHQ